MCNLLALSGHVPTIEQLTKNSEEVIDCVKRCHQGQERLLELGVGGVNNIELLYFCEQVQEP